MAKLYELTEMISFAYEAGCTKKQIDTIFTPFIKTWQRKFIEENADKLKEWEREYMERRGSK